MIPSLLQTERLILRPWREDDLEPFAQMNADPRVREFFSSTLTREQSDAAIRRYQDQYAEHGFCFLAAELRQTGAFAGFIGMQIMDFPIPNIAQPAVEIGWRLPYSLWGKGLATEGARAVMDHALRRQKLHQVVAITAPNNVRSRHVMEKIGMQYIQDGDFDHPRIPEGNPMRRHVVYVSP
ncbi:MAG TPA: GNAT family N-acetyltransferase [Acidobacteriaceae bacterium]|jgi:RimJ/RimL family protein N-acetyltransferase|nr:GNAT family N-acetyltransferase [Acidobacteriaceae bacterium]